MKLFKKLKYPLIFISLFSIFYYLRIKDQDRGYYGISKKLVQEFSKEMKKEYNLSLRGDGGNLRKGVEYLVIYFHSSFPVNLEEASGLERIVTRRFLEKVNADTKIRPYLRDYPFPMKRVEVSIFFDDCWVNPTIKKPVLVYFDDDGNMYQDFYDYAEENFKSIEYIDDAPSKPVVRKSRKGFSTEDLRNYLMIHRIERVRKLHSN